MPTNIKQFGSGAIFTTIVYLFLTGVISWFGVTSMKNHDSVTVISHLMVQNTIEHKIIMEMLTGNQKMVLQHDKDLAIIFLQMGDCKTDVNDCMKQIRERLQK